MQKRITKRGEQLASVGAVEQKQTKETKVSWQKNGGRKIR